MQRRRFQRAAVGLLASLSFVGTSIAADPVVPASVDTSWTPEDDWRDSHELETFSSICEELPIQDVCSQCPCERAAKNCENRTSCGGQCPPDSWRDTNEPETLSTECEELVFPAACSLANDCGTVVLDVDKIGEAPTFVSLGDGSKLKIIRRGERIAIEVLHEEELTAVDYRLRPTMPAPISLGVEGDNRFEIVDENDLRGVTVGNSPMPIVLDDPVADLIGLDTSVVCTRYDENLADFQATYSQLMATGHSEQAQALATSFLGDENIRGLPTDLPRKLDDSVLSPPRGVLLHEVRYRGQPDRCQVLYPSESNAVWEEVSRRTISLNFRGATIVEAAEFLHMATGLAVSINVPAEVAKTKRLHVSCNEQTVKSALEAICRVGGFPFAVVDNRIVITCNE